MTQANLLTQLRGDPVTDRGVSVLPPLEPELATLPIAEEWKDDGIPLALLEAIAALSSGTRVREAVSLAPNGAHWYLAWNGREGGDWAGELDAEARTFRCDAPIDEARFGFAAAGICLAWSQPAPEFDGQWATLLGTVAVEGVAAYRPKRVRTIARTVLQVLEREGKTWELDHSKAECPELSDEVTQELAKHLGGALIPRVLADFGLFCEAAAVWDRTAGALRPRAEQAPVWAPISKALAAGLHVVVSGPPRVGKTTAIRRALENVRDAKVIELRAATPEEIDGLFLENGEDHASCACALVNAISGCTDNDDRPARTIVHLHLDAEPAGRAAAALGAILDGSPDSLADILGIDPRLIGGPIGCGKFQLVIEVPDGCLLSASSAAYVQIGAPRSENVLDQSAREDLGWLAKELRRCAKAETVERAALPAELRACERLASSLIGAGRERRAAFREAVELTLVDRIGKLRPIWPEMAARWEAALRRPANCAKKSRAPGRGVWCDLQQVRATVDWLASLVRSDGLLVLEPNVTDADGDHVLYEWAPDCRDVRVSTDLWMAEDAPEALALTVWLATTACGHRRWSGPTPDFDPGEDAPRAERDAAARRRKLHVWLDHARIQALLDGVRPEILGPYRRRGAVVRLRDLPHRPEARPGSFGWFMDLIREDIFAATGGGLPMDDAPCPLRRSVPAELRWQVSRVLAARAEAAALGENSAALPDVVMGLEAVLDGVC